MRISDWSSDVCSSDLRISWAQWANTVMGLWLMFAPLLFWTPSPASYGNALLVGGLVIAFSTLVPMMPGMSMSGMMQKAAVPPGWEYNPSRSEARRVGRECVSTGRSRWSHDPAKKKRQDTKKH